MSLKPLGEDKKQIFPEELSKERLEKLSQALDQAPLEIIDSTLQVEAEPNYDAPDPEELLAKMQAAEQQRTVGHTLHDKEFYESKKGFIPGGEIVAEPKGKPKKKEAKPATEIDLENLDESMIMNLPQIKAASFELNNFLHLKFKDKTLRGRWANCKNYVQGNLHRFLQLGYKIAEVADIDETQTPVDISMIDGTQIKYHDVILLKIDVIRLMELYKAGILKSQDRLVRAREKGLAQAQVEFKNFVNAEPGAARAYNEMSAAHGGKELVSFELEK